MRDQQADVEEEPGEVGIETINTRILSKLNEFDAHTRRKETCLGCGYVGVMGIEDEIAPWWLRWWSIILITVVGSLFMGAGLGIGVGLVSAKYFGNFDSMILVCPNCGEQYVDA